MLKPVLSNGWVRNCHIRVSALDLQYLWSVHGSKTGWCRLPTVHRHCLHACGSHQKVLRKVTEPLGLSFLAGKQKSLNFPLHVKATNTKWHLICGCVLWVMKWDTRRFWLLVWCRFSISTALQKRQRETLMGLNPSSSTAWTHDTGPPLSEQATRGKNLPVSLHTVPTFCRVK